MGVGKSTIGKNLAYKLSYSFIDIDKAIEEYEGSSIDIIFKNKGENYFRTIEKKITLKKLKENKNGILSFPIKPNPPFPWCLVGAHALGSVLRMTAK